MAQHPELQQHLKERQESRLPPYWHPNELASAVAWLRLFRVASLARDNQPRLARILDFGSSVGELGHLFSEPHTSYEFIEQDEAAAGYLQSRLPAAVRQTLQTAPDGSYDCVFAIDAVQRSREYPVVLRQLCDKLRHDGILVISGAEKWPAKPHRQILELIARNVPPAIHEVEQEARQVMRLKDRAAIFPGVPLFRISVWRRYRSAA